MEAGMDSPDIMQSLPHRYPFLLVDGILEIVPRERITALKNVSMNEHFFQGHFPGLPIMPGVLIVEALAQAGGFLLLKSRPPDQARVIFYFMGMDRVRFRKPVVPGDQLILQLEVITLRTKAGKMSAKATVDGKLVAEAELMASVGESE